jgi:multidrug resistance efflux pump
MVAPISGTVVAVNVTRSGSATAGSTAFVVCGPHRYQVVVNVPVTGMPELKIGQRASVLPDGRSTPLHGLVASSDWHRSPASHQRPTPS